MLKKYKITRAQYVTLICNFRVWCNTASHDDFEAASSIVNEITGYDPKADCDEIDFRSLVDSGDLFGYMRTLTHSNCTELEIQFALHIIGVEVG